MNYTIAHISDLHFSQGTDMSNPDHAHSIPHLRALQAMIKKLNPDILVVSGDISNNGDKQSLINASAYLEKKIPIGSEEYIGLELPLDKLGVVPGNHDAWNASQAGKFVDRRQKSLEHYNFAFPSHKIPPNDGCYYDWREHDDMGIYLAYVDSCFLGDTEKHDDSPFGTIRYDQAIAKGKLSVQQTEKLLEWHDLGTRGTLPDPRNGEIFIGKASFSKALKILVMHHYLFEPPEHSSDYFMRLHHRDIVFRNIAFADFDILLCGHKHFPAFDVHTYGSHFDERATNRYLVNCFRRLIGLHSLPVQIDDDDGRRWSKALTALANTILKLVRRRNPNATPKAVAEEVLQLLKQGLHEPDSLEKNVKKFLHENGLDGAEVVESRELNEIQKRLAIGLTTTERKALQGVAKRIVNITKKLHSRPFLQIMSGSTAKACGAGNRKRTFDLLRIECGGKDWKVQSERYFWDWGSNAFLDDPLVQNHVFSRIL